MFKRILVPTDGSPLAERAFPLAERIAASQGASLIVARVMPPMTWLGYDPTISSMAETYQQFFDAMDDECQRYLANVAERFRGAGLTVETELVHGIPGAALVDLEAKFVPDLVVMGSHGRSGLARFALGSVADLTVREGTAPVLIVRSHAPALSGLERALVPLDGSALAESALPMVQAMAVKPIDEVRLLRVVDIERDRAEADDYLERIADRLRAYGLKVTKSVTLGPPAEAIARIAPSHDLVILGTHGRGGFDRLRHGSVATAAIRTLTTPTLLVRVGPPVAAVVPAAFTAASLV